MRRRALSRSVHHGLFLLLASGAVAGCTDDVVAPATTGARFCGSGTVRLEVGEVAVPRNVTDGRCKFPPIVGAEYAMSWVDLRAINSSVEGPELSFEPYLVRITFDIDRAIMLRSAATADSAVGPAVGAQRAGSPIPDPASSSHQGLVLLANDGVLESRPRNRTTPLVLDEVFFLEDEWTGLARPARVVRVHPDGLVVVRWDVEPQEGFDTFLLQLDSAWAILGDHAMPTVRGIFADAMPRSTGAGQTLILAQQEIAVAMRSFGEVSGDSLFTWLDLYAFPWTSSTRMAQSLAHETTHLYQMMYMHASRPMPGLETRRGAAFWGIEGGANLMSYEMLRRMANVAPDANHEWRSAAPSLAAEIFQLRAQPSVGILTDGYDSAMGFMRDLVLRRMLVGETHADALREVSRGALEGWYGHDGATIRRGLVSRSQERLGADWTPATAILDWALSYIGDDITPNPRYQDRASLRVWDVPITQGYAWRADALMTRDTPPQYFFKTYGSPGYALFLDGGSGMNLDVNTFEVPIAWKVLRIR